MKFAAPEWLWFLLLIPVLYGVFLWDEKLRERKFEAFAKKSLWASIAPEIDPGARMKKAVLWLLVAFFSLLSLARPQWGTREESAKMSGLDIMVVLDVSNSMETEDVVPSRLKKAKHLLRTMAERLQGDRLGLVTFAGGASVSSPLTTDTEYFLEQLQIQGPRLIPTQGTDIGLGLETAMRALERGAENTSGSENEVQPSRAIVLITDGEDHEQQASELAAQLKSQGIRLYVFGVGTEKGGPVPLRDDYGSLLNYKRDQSGQPVVSSFKPDSLVQLAATAGGRYWNVTLDEAEVDEMLKDMGALTRGEFAEHHYLVYEERFQYPLAIAVFFLILEMSFSTRRRFSAAALFFFAVGGSFVVSPNAFASGVDTYLENKKGVEAYKEGKIEEAQKRFGSAQAMDPGLPELQYNQGLIKMQQGDADGAIRNFQDSARGAMTQGNQPLVGESFFNLGSALSKKGDVKGAIQSYLAAINSAQKTGNESLEQAARKNIELLVQEQQKQKQQQQNQQQQQQQQNQQNPDQQQQNQQGKPDQDKKEGGKPEQSDQGEKKDPKDQKQEQQRYDQQSSRGKKFESKKLTDEDAERVMAELKNRERNLQVRLKKQNGNRNTNLKDW